MYGITWCIERWWIIWGVLSYLYVYPLSWCSLASSLPQPSLPLCVYIVFEVNLGESTPDCRIAIGHPWERGMADIRRWYAKIRRSVEIWLNLASWYDESMFVFHKRILDFIMLGVASQSKGSLMILSQCLNLLTLYPPHPYQVSIPSWPISLQRSGFQPDPDLQPSHVYQSVSPLLCDLHPRQPQKTVQGFRAVGLVSQSVFLICSTLQRFPSVLPSSLNPFSWTRITKGKKRKDILGYRRERLEPHAQEVQVYNASLRKCNIEWESIRGR